MKFMIESICGGPERRMSEKLFGLQERHKVRKIQHKSSLHIYIDIYIQRSIKTYLLTMKINK